MASRGLPNTTHVASCRSEPWPRPPPGRPVLEPLGGGSSGARATTRGSHPVRQPCNRRVNSSICRRNSASCGTRATPQKLFSRFLTRAMSAVVSVEHRAAAASTAALSANRLAWKAISSPAWTVFEIWSLEPFVSFISGTLSVKLWLAESSMHQPVQAAQLLRRQVEDFRNLRHPGRRLAGRRGAASREGNGLWAPGDRKSTRLNSSHRCISYAVFCLKKKNH